MSTSQAREKRYYMACLDLEGKSVLVVGGGEIALEKTRELLACGASVTVVAPKIHEQLRALPIEWQPRRYEPANQAGRWLVVSATDSEALNERVARDARIASRFCNVVDDPARCTVILPAVHRQGPIAIAVSTSGASPALAKRIRDLIAEQIDSRYADLAHQLKALRPWAKRNLPTYADRKEYFEQLVARALS